MSGQLIKQSFLRVFYYCNMSTMFFPCIIELFCRGRVQTRPYGFTHVINFCFCNAVLCHASLSLTTYYTVDNIKDADYADFSFVSVFLCVLSALVCGELLRFPSSKRGLREC